MKSKTFLLLGAAAFAAAVTVPDVKAGTFSFGITLGTPYPPPVVLHPPPVCAPIAPPVVYHYPPPAGFYFQFGRPYPRAYHGPPRFHHHGSHRVHGGLRGHVHHHHQAPPPGRRHH